MKRKLLGLIIAMNIFGLNSYAQNAREITTELKKSTVPAFQADYDLKKDLINEALENKFKKAGFKSKKSSGYCKYSEVMMPEISPNKVDVYTKVSGKKGKATVLMLVSTGYNNFISTNTDAATSSNTLTFLNNLKNDAAEVQAAIDLAAQQKALKNAKEKLEDSEREKAKLAKRKADLDKKLEVEKKTQEEAAQKVEREKIRLENLKKGAE